MTIRLRVYGPQRQQDQEKLQADLARSLGLCEVIEWGPMNCTPRLICEGVPEESRPHIEAKIQLANRWFVVEFA